MYLICADGSGQTRIIPNRKNNGLYILSGVIVHESDWKELEDNVTAIKKELFPDVDPDDFDLHAYDIWNSRGFFADKKLNKPGKKAGDLRQGYGSYL